MDKTKFSKRLAMLREELGMTQGELADNVGLSRSAIGMYEQGRREPDFDAVDALSDFFDVGMLYLIGASDIRERYPRHEAERRIVDPEVSKVLFAYEKAPAKTQLMVRMLLGLDEQNDSVNNKEVTK